MDFLIEHGGYLGIVVFLILTGCGMPIPEEVPIVLAGVLSSQGNLEPVLALVSCIVGAIIGDSVMYSIGYHFGHGLIMRHPRVAKLLGAERELYFEQAVQRHMFKVMLLARFMVGVRGPVYLAAGMVRVPYRNFLLCDLVCATVVVGTFFSLAYFFGDHITRLVRDAEYGVTLLVALAALGALLWYLRRNRQRALDEAIAHQGKLQDAEEGQSDAKQHSTSDKQSA